MEFPPLTVTVDIIGQSIIMYAGNIQIYLESNFSITE